MLAGVAGSAGGQEWTGAISNDWFTAGNWANPSAVPAAGSFVVINQAPPALASSLATGAAPITIGGLIIGGSAGAPFGPGRSGQLTIEGLALTTGSLSVGTLFGPDPALIASGMLDSNSDVNALSGLTVGALGSDATGASASGQVALGGNLTGGGAATLASIFVGFASSSADTASGSASGLITVGGNLTGYQSIVAGAAFRSATAATDALDATGHVTVGGDLRLDALPGFRASLLVGSSFTTPPSTAGGVANGSISVAGALTSALPLDITVGQAGGPGTAVGSVSAGSFSAASVGALVVGTASPNSGTVPTSTNATGSVTFGAGDIVLDSSNFGVFVGRADSFANTSTTATGTLISGGQLDASATGAPFMQIGVANASSSGAAATSNANGSAQFGGASGFSGLQIGVANAGGAGANASATGALQLGSGGLTGSAAGFGSVTVGSTSVSSDGVATANGLLTITGGSMTQFSFLQIGSGVGATGRVEIAGGNLLMTDSVAGGVFVSSIVVGLTGGNGTLRVTDGDVSAGALFVGTNFGSPVPSLPTVGVAEFVRSTVDVGTGDVENSFHSVGFEGRGELRLTDSAMNVHGSLTVGSGTVDPTQEGLIELTRSILAVDGVMFLGDFARLEFVIGGLDRGTGYGAIDTGTGLLNGVLSIAFDFTPLPGTHFFDLVVAGMPSGGAFGTAGLTGMFDSVTVTGLGAQFASSILYLPFTSDPAVIQIVRLQISSVPEPATWMLLLALVALAVVLRRDRAGRLVA